jgi:transposase-like protein
MPYTNQEKMFALINEKQPDERVDDFCKRHDIKVATYYYWVKKYRQQQMDTEAKTFIPIQVSTPQGAALASVQLPGGAILTVYHSEAFSFIRTLL